MPERIKAEQVGVGFGLWRTQAIGCTEYLRADLALPRPWATVEELEALPVGSVVMEAGGRAAWRKTGVGDDGDVEWFSTSHEVGHALTIPGPGVVVFTPSAA
jgi:hypothetical protein